MGILDIFTGGDSPQATARHPSQFTEADWNSIRPKEMGGTANPRQGGQVPGYYDSIKEFDPKWTALQSAQQNASNTQQIATAQATAPPPPAYSGPTAEAKLQGLLPSGFENTLIPSSVADPYISSTISKARGSAQSLIDNMLKRGTVTGTGRSAGLSSLTAQDAGVRNKLTGISNVLLENERAKLRGIANEGYGAASGQSGETFDPNPYYGRANTDASQFLSAFPASYTTAVGDTGGLYSTGGLGAVTGPNNISYDPYAQEGGKLSTGLDELGSPPAAKKRSTSVF